MTESVKCRNWRTINKSKGIKTADPPLAYPIINDAMKEKIKLRKIH